MTKQYPLISLNGFLYAVDKKSHKGKYLIFQSKEIQTPNTVEGEMFENYPLYYDEVIASNDPSLKDIPILPEITEDIVAALAKIGLNNPTAGEVGAYKAASKGYSEEDVIKLLEHIREYEDFYEIVDGKHLKTFIPSYSKQYLIPQPIAVECEMVERWKDLGDRGDGKHIYETNHWQPKVDNNHLIGRYVYE